MPDLTCPLPLWPAGAPLAHGQDTDDIPTLTCYPSALPGRAAIVVCPGGGYHHLAPHEGEGMALWLNGLGLTVYVLSYRHSGRGYRHPVPLLDAQRALRLARFLMVRDGFADARMGIMGFSAGGHLAATAATHGDDGNPVAPDPVDRLSCRPDFLILGYPVITFVESFTHQGSRENLLGKDSETGMWRRLSAERNVTHETPPTFLVHASDDAGVPPENSVCFYQALRRAGVPAELHIYLEGGHGFGLGRDNLPVCTWPERCADWLRRLGVIAPA